MVMAAQPAPSHVHLRMYRVGFGDCFLLSFDYPVPLPDGRSVRHVLIDFGSTSLAKNQSNLVPIAKQINAHTNGGELDVVVVSHRHRDHLSAFGVQEIPVLLAKEGYP
jgi:glyoxylase-like metal-dependent hydrolase (beta-lactamase superfamily II)